VIFGDLGMNFDLHSPKVTCSHLKIGLLKGNSSSNPGVSGAMVVGPGGQPKKW